MSELQRLGEIALIIAQQPVLGHWPAGRAADDAQYLRDLETYVGYLKKQLELAKAGRRAQDQLLQQAIGGDGENLMDRVLSQLQFAAADQAEIQRFRKALRWIESRGDHCSEVANEALYGPTRGGDDE